MTIVNPIDALDSNVKNIINQIETLDPDSDQARQNLANSCDQAINLIMPMLDRLWQIQAEFEAIDQFNNSFLKLLYIGYLREKYPGVFKTKD